MTPLEQAQADIQSKHSATHYGKARALKEHAALVAFLQENQIASLDETQLAMLGTTQISALSAQRTGGAAP